MAADALAVCAVVITALAAQMESDAIDRACDSLEAMPLASDPTGRNLIEALRLEAVGRGR